MSINFDKAINSELRDKLLKLFGSPMADDGKTFLYDRGLVLDTRVMTEIAKEAKQPVAVELNSEDEIKTFSDGTRYLMTTSGWRRVFPT